jgi:hypothetical protein
MATRDERNRRTVGQDRQLDRPGCEADAAEALEGYQFVRDLVLIEGQGVTGATYLGAGEPAA